MTPAEARAHAREQWTRTWPAGTSEVEIVQDIAAHVAEQCAKEGGGELDELAREILLAGLRGNRSIGATSAFTQASKFLAEAARRREGKA